VQIVPPNEVVVVISFEVALGEIRGMVNLCIPYNSIERISGKLSANSWVSWARKATSPECAQQIGQTLRGSLVSLHVRLAGARISTGDLIGLRVGDIITTEKDIRRPLLVTVEGIPKFRANAGLFKGHKAVRVNEVIANPADAIGD
jgi:flagellar motor switch protein FliM